MKHTTPLSVSRVSRKYGSLDVSIPHRSPQPVTMIALPKTMKQKTKKKTN
jgi:hypothetical protein